jgi:MFS family permease
LLGCWLADRRQRAGDGAAAVRVLMICALALVVPAAVAPLMPTVAGALAFLFWTFVLGSATVGPTIAALHALTPNRLRAQVVALLYFFVNLIGLGVGPLAVAVVTDYVFADDLAVRWSIALVATVLAVAGAAFCLRAFAAWRRA